MKNKVPKETRMSKQQQGRLNTGKTYIHTLSSSTHCSFLPHPLSLLCIRCICVFSMENVYALPGKTIHTVLQLNDGQKNTILSSSFIL